MPPPCRDADLSRLQKRQQPLASFQHIHPGGFKITSVPRVGDIARALGVIHQQTDFVVGVLAEHASQVAQVVVGVNMKVTSGPVLDKPGDLAGLLTSLEKGDVLFIDEIHRLSAEVEEYLYSAMEDYVIDIMIDKVRICLNCRQRQPDL